MLEIESLRLTKAELHEALSSSPDTIADAQLSKALWWVIEYWDHMSTQRTPYLRMGELRDAVRFNLPRPKEPSTAAVQAQS